MSVQQYHITMSAQPYHVVSTISYSINNIISEYNLIIAYNVSTTYNIIHVVYNVSTIITCNVSTISYISVQQYHTISVQPYHTCAIDLFVVKTKAGNMISAAVK